MEALVLFVFFGLYIIVRVLLGGGESEWDKQVKRYQAGVTAFRNRDYPAAADFFGPLHVRHPYDVLPVVFLGELSLVSGETEAALALGNRALRLDNTVWQPHYLMARALEAAGMPAEALKRARNAAWIGRNQAATHYLLGRLLLAEGSTAKGLAEMEKAYALGEEDAVLFLRRSPLRSKL
jgi:tetratricopeptide (TPR) repeat protein